MKTEQVNNVFGIILKGIATICIILITFFYWQNKDTGKYRGEKTDDGIQLLNTQTGEITLVGAAGDQSLRLKINPFAKDKQKIFGEKDFFTGIK